MNESQTPATMEEEYNPEGVVCRRWSDFVTSELVDFFTGNKLEKLTIEDGNGNKAKLSHTKDNEIKIESASTTII